MPRTPSLAKLSSAIGLCFLTSSSSLLGAEGLSSHLVSSSPVGFGEGRGRQEFSRLLIADAPSFHTRVIYSKQGLFPRQAKGMVFLLPGTSARVDTEYGIQQSQSPQANYLVRQQRAVVALQPPIYHLSHDVSRRSPFLREYGELEPNLHWLRRVVHAGWADAPVVEEERPIPSSVLVGRSTFSAISLEALHRFERGDEDSQYIGHFSDVVCLGVDGHKERDIRQWFQNEIDFYFRKNPWKVDVPVMLAAPRIFRAMGWQTQTVPPSDAFKNRPRVWLTVGARDEFGKPSESMQPILDFAANHPMLDVRLLFHDGFHDPARAVLNVTQTMERMKTMWTMILESSNTYRPGLKVIYVPDKDTVISAIPADDTVRCASALYADGIEAAAG